MSHDKFIGEIAGAGPARGPKGQKPGFEVPANASCVLSITAAVCVGVGALLIDPRAPFRDVRPSAEAAHGDGVCEDIVVTGRPTWQELFSSLLLLDSARRYAIDTHNGVLRARGEDPVTDESAQVPDGASIRACAVTPVEPALRRSPARAAPK